MKNDTATTDILNIAGDLVPPIDAVLEELLERGKKERVMILAGTEGGKGRKPYAITRVSIDFDNEQQLRQCVRMLRWSDERLRARPDQMVLWDWSNTSRDGMAVFFGVSWYDATFFERRKNAFLEPQHASYYAAFGATPDRFRLEHEILTPESP